MKSWVCIFTLHSEMSLAKSVLESKIKNELNEYLSHLSEQPQ